MSLGRLVAGVAHEINNPSSFITVNVQVLKKLYAGLVAELDTRCSEQGDFPVGGLLYSQVRTDIVQLLDGIATGAQRIKETVHLLQDYAQPGAAGLDQRVELNEVVRAALQLLHPMVRRSTFHLETAYADALPALPGNFPRLVQVVVALLQNACEALPCRERAIRVTTQHDPAGHLLVLTIADEGAGIAAADMAHLFTPFFTTKQARGCLGLGLYVARQILTEHRATISIASPAGGGTTATVRLPLPHRSRPSTKAHG